jgi:hypothetical protein
MIQTQCLVEGDGRTRIEAEIRFLHMTRRQLARFPSAQSNGDQHVTPEYIDSLEIDGQLHESWEEAVERRVPVEPRQIDELIVGAVAAPFTFPVGRMIEHLKSREGCVVGAIYRERKALDGVIELSSEPASDGLYAITLRISNESAASTADWHEPVKRNSQRQALVSTHAILAVEGGQFISLTDPPDRWRDAASQLENDGTWPVLVGDQRQRNMMLSSPITLYDYPQLAAETAGDLFDATEIDEILSLRVLTMTDDEKRRMQTVDKRAREILRRTQSLPDEQFRKLHGAIRGMRRLESVQDL